MEIIRKNKIFLSVMLCMFLIVCAFLITNDYIASAEQTLPDGSFASIAEAGSDYLSNAYATIADSGNMPSTAGACGGALGYSGSTLKEVNNMSNEDDGRHVIATKLLCNYDTHDTAAYDYAALRRVSSLGKTDNPNDPFVGYAYYGMSLNQLGLDETTYNGFNGNLRKYVGIVVTALYLLTEFLYAFWEVVIGVLNAFNLFAVFGASAGTLETAKVTAALSGGSSSVGKDIASGWGEITGRLGDFYEQIQGLSVAFIIPMFIALSIFIWLVVRQGRDTFNTFKKVAIRLVFTVIGVPLLFACYSIALSFISNVNGGNGSLGADAVTSNFIDFESWCLGDVSNASSKCALLDASYAGSGGIQVDSSTNKVSGESLSKVREYCYNINKKFAVNSGGNMNTSSMQVGDAGFTDYDIALIDQLRKNNSVSAERAQMVYNLLDRYSKGTKVGAAALESKAKSEIDAETLIKEQAACENWQMFDSQWTDSIYYKYKVGDVEVSSKDGPLGSQFGSTLFSGDLSYSGGKFASGSLSYMSMYNYLNTSFGSDQMVVHSSKNVISQDAKIEHFSVNLIGPGVMKIMYVVDICVVMIAFCVVGYGYGLGLLYSNFKAMLKIIPAVFSGMLGSMRGIATAVVITFAMMGEVLATCAIYGLAVEAIRLSYNIISKPLASLICSAFSAIGLDTSSGLAVPFITTFVNTVIMLFLIKKLIEYRYAICQAISESMTHVVNNFFGTNAANPGLSMKPDTMMNLGKGAVMVGAGGMMLANNHAKDVASIGERMGSAGLISTSEAAGGAGDSTSEQLSEETATMTRTDSGGTSDGRTEQESQEILAANQNFVAGEDSGEASADTGDAATDASASADSSDSGTNGAAAGTSSTGGSKSAGKKAESSKSRSSKSLVEDANEDATDNLTRAVTRHTSADGSIVHSDAPDSLAGESAYAGMTDDTEAFNGRSSADVVGDDSGADANAVATRGGSSGAEGDVEGGSAGSVNTTQSATATATANSSSSKLVASGDVSGESVTTSATASAKNNKSVAVQQTAAAGSAANNMPLPIGGQPTVAQANVQGQSIQIGGLTIDKTVAADLAAGVMIAKGVETMTGSSGAVSSALRSAQNVVVNYTNVASNIAAGQVSGGGQTSGGYVQAAGTSGGTLPTAGSSGSYSSGGGNVITNNTVTSVVGDTVGGLGSNTADVTVNKNTTVMYSANAGAGGTRVIQTGGNVSSAGGSVSRVTETKEVTRVVNVKSNNSTAGSVVTAKPDAKIPSSDPLANDAVLFENQDTVAPTAKPKAKPKTKSDDGDDNSKK